MGTESSFKRILVDKSDSIAFARLHHSKSSLKLDQNKSDGSLKLLRESGRGRDGFHAEDGSI